MKNIHNTAQVYSEHIGDDTSIWQFAVVLSGARIGKNCNINCHTFIENDVILGDNVTIKSGVYLWDGIRIEDNVFIGPCAAFTNDQFPRSKVYHEKFQQTLIKTGASIGANATILGGIVIGAYSLIGAGSVVTKNVSDYCMVYGNPAIVTGWVDKRGRKLQKRGNEWRDAEDKKYIVENNQLTAL